MVVLVSNGAPPANYQGTAHSESVFKLYCGGGWGGGARCSSVVECWCPIGLLRPTIKVLPIQSLSLTLYLPKPV